MLDVGCGPGFLLEVARSMGLNACGLDVSRAALGSASSSRGLVQGTISAVAEEPIFDLVTAFETLEHIHEPIAFLDEAAHRIAPGGLLALTTPNPDSILSRALGESWPSLKAPEHLHLFTPQAIEKALPPSFDILEISPTGRYMSLGFALGKVLELLPFPSNGSGKLPLKQTVYVPAITMFVIARKTTGAI